MQSPAPRRSLPTRLAFAATLLALVALLASCVGDDDDDGGGGGSDTASFCDEVKSILTTDNDQRGEEPEAKQE